jgi:tRNA (guanine-N1)-methyltransferase
LAAGILTLPCRGNMRIDTLTLFPEMFSVVGDLGVTGRARRLGLWSLHVWNPRDYTHDVHRSVDDRPYGGGPGMVMLAQPLESALDDALRDRGSDEVPVVLMSPTGRRFDQHMAQELAQGSGAVFICGRYEGIDQRFIDRRVTHEVSLGDFVLSGGEIPAMACIDAAVRLLPGALNDDESARQDSFNETTSGLLDSPHYTRPEVYQGLEVPEILRSGHHANIAAWRREQSLALTAARRPDLIEAARLAGRLTKKDEAFLKALKADA